VKGRLSLASEVASPLQSEVADRPWRQRLLFVVKLLVAASLLGWLFASGRLDFSPLLNVRQYECLGLACLAILGSMLVLVWRWKWLLAAQGLPITTLSAIRMTWTGYFANTFLPGSAGGDLAKAFVACRYHPGTKTRAASSVFMDRAFGMHSLCFVGLVAGLCIVIRGCTARQSGVIWLAALCFTGASVGLFLLLWRPTAGMALRLLPQRFRKVSMDSLERYRQRWKMLAVIWLYSVLCNLLSIASYILVAAALGVEVNFAQLLAIPLVIVSSSIPISPGGLGVAEAAGAQLFMEFGIPAGGLIVLATRLGTVLFSIPGAFGVLGRTGTRPSPMEDAP
jgi:uncharacterized protein (TIRG00374 family)